VRNCDRFVSQLVLMTADALLSSLCPLARPDLPAPPPFPAEVSLARPIFASPAASPSSSD